MELFSGQIARPFVLIDPEIVSTAVQQGGRMVLSEVSVILPLHRWQGLDPTIRTASSGRYSGGRLWLYLIPLYSSR